jgi:membrane protease subunit (stomatin/prohibitin family)
MQGMQATYGNAADQAYRQAREQQKSEDPAEKIKKLGQMKDSGLITQEEFDAKKAEILSEM